MAGKVLAVASLLLLMATAPGLAQPVDSYGLSAEDIAAFKKEPPLSQADIDILLLFWPQIRVNSHPMKVAEICKKAGLTETRLIFISARTVLGMSALHNDIPREKFFDDSVHPVLVPSEAEMALIEKHMTALKKAFGDITL